MRVIKKIDWKCGAPGHRKGVQRVLQPLTLC
jgi:hypothetical protein